MGFKLWLAAALVAASLTGCMSVYSPVVGVLYTDVKGPLDAGTSVGSREGEACAETLLGLIARGDASIKQAAKNGGITNIASVDHRTENLLGVIGRFCTIVRGS